MMVSVLMMMMETLFLVIMMAKETVQTVALFFGLKAPNHGLKYPKEFKLLLNRERLGSKWM